MRPTALIAAVAALACLGSLSTAAACEGGKRKEIVERFDADRDGKLSETERAAAKAAMHEQIAKRKAEVLAKHPELDADKDGALSKDERKAGAANRKAEHQAGFKAKHPEAFAKVDSNGDGTIAKEERQAARAQAKERFLAKHPDADQDQDGKLERSERKAFRKDHGGDKKHDHGRKAN